MSAGDAPAVSGLILAGGAGRRVGGADKGWLEHQGTPLVHHVHSRLAPQVDEIIISANRSQARYATLGRVVGDTHRSDEADYAGPLAGIEAGLAAAHNDWVLCVPCDTPELPRDLLATLWAGLGRARLAVACCGGHWQPTVCLLHQSLQGAAAAALAAGERKLRAWQAAQAMVLVDFADAAAFANINELPR